MRGALLLLAVGVAVSAGAAEPVRLMTLDPGHFHAALIQKEMYPGVDPTVHVFAPVGPDLLLHLGRVRPSTSGASGRPAGGSRCTRGPTTSSACCARSRATWS